MFWLKMKIRRLEKLLKAIGAECLSDTLSESEEIFIKELKYLEKTNSRAFVYYAGKYGDIQTGRVNSTWQ